MIRSARQRFKSMLLPLLLCIAIGVFMGAGGYTFFYAHGTSYLSNDPQACVNCHIMDDQYNSWIKSSHHAVAVCNDCHIPHTFPEKYLVKAENGWNHSKKFTLQNFEEPIRIREQNRKVLHNNCIECHKVMVGDIAGHADVVLEESRCTTCHRSVGHSGAY